MIEDLKVYLINSVTLASLFSTLDSGLKTLLVLCSVVYTIFRIYYLYKNKGK